ncbi:MAG: flagellar hook-basal body complex protein, partial [Verrucomicrobiota bacterium]|nr:flagellar hook-basal body complex protein [Verrucomicrobiota bacterium]
MIRALNTGVMGMRQFQTSLDVIGNNLANINTVAYKGARVEFADTLSQTMRAPTPDTATTSGSIGMQVGNGMQVSAIKNTFTQGAMKNTGVRTDLAINGKGFFLVKDSTTNELFATRAGDFREDKNGYLVTNDGFRVQGKNKMSPAYTENQKQEIGDLKLDAGQYTA